VEEEVKAGIQRFKEECERQLPGIALVIPVRPTQASYLVSFSFQGQRTYGTVHEDDFADWGEGLETQHSLSQEVAKYVAKLLQQIE